MNHIQIFFIVFYGLVAIIAVIYFIRKRPKIKISLENGITFIVYFLIFIGCVYLLYNLSQTAEGRKDLQEVSREMQDGRY